MEVKLIMADQTLSNVTILLRNDTVLNWNTEDPVLGKGEIGIEIDTGKFKFGDGIKSWSQLGYSGVLVTASNINGNIKIDGVETTVYILPMANSNTLGGIKSSTGKGAVEVDSTTGTASVSAVLTADQLANARTIGITGDVSGSASFDGTANISISAVLAASGVTAGTYTKVTVDSKGRVTFGETLSASDIPTITLSKISDAGTAASKDVGTSSGNVPILDSNGKLDTAVLPSLAIGDTKTVTTESDRLALTTSDVQKGDVVIVTGTNKTYRVVDDTKLDLEAGYAQILTPDSPVQSVNSKTGHVTLTTSDIAEGSNLYYTQNRFDTAFAAKASTGLSDGATIVKTTDTLILDCGNA